MARHDDLGVISRKRRSELIRYAKRRAGHWLHQDAEGVGLDDEAEDKLVREAIKRIAKRLIAEGLKR